MSFRTEVEDGIEYRIVDFEGRIPGGEGIEFLSAQKVWSLEYRHTPYIGIAYTLNGEDQPNGLGLDMGHGAFERDFLWDFMDQPAHLAVFERAVKPIIDLLFAEGMFEGELEGLL